MTLDTESPMNFNKAQLLNYSFPFLSAVLLMLAFPKTELSQLAWVGLIPLMTILDGKSARESFVVSYVCGLIFFSFTLYWLMFVHPAVAFLGMPLMIAYLSIYFGLFGLGYSYFYKKSSLVKIIVLPSLWVALEFLRAHLLTGFSWGSLGQSQYKNLVMIQIADLTGMFGVSFLIVMVNYCLKVVLFEKKQAVKVTLVASVAILATFSYGLVRLTQPASGPTARLGVIQANIPQSLKWYSPAWNDVVEQHFLLTQRAAEENPDLIIWPETSLPGILQEEPRYFAEISRLVERIKTPVLFGVVDNKEEDVYHNAAILLSKQADIVQQYNKVHLVPFGEYLPFRSLLPKFIADVVPMDDFTAGHEYTLFPFSSDQKVNFSVLICFEDTVARVTRKFVNQGAQLLVNMTNDAWFLDTKAPFMHLQSAVFRAVENRRSLVRAANTGVSCFVDPRGRIVNGVVNDKNKMTYVLGYLVETVYFNDEKTFYTKFGDLFAYFCFACILWGVLNRKRA